jgi:uncharacterized protein (TIGR03435 family)
MYAQERIVTVTNNHATFKLSCAGIILLVAAASTALAIPSAFAQSNAPPNTVPAQTVDQTSKPITFEVATIKPTATTDSWRLPLPTPDGYTATNVSLLQLIGEAYGVVDPKLLSGGPPWIDKKKFDLEAKFDPSELPNAKDLTHAQRAAMLQPLLADRFHLKLHHETKDLPVFNLVTAKVGSKLQSAPGAPADDMISTTCEYSRGPGYAQAARCSMKNVVDALRDITGRTVIDKTGLTGVYNYTLRWTPDNAPAPAASDTPAPDIFTAVQEQFGLKLEPSTAPLDTLVIDSAEMPTPN